MEKALTLFHESFDAFLFLINALIGAATMPALGFLFLILIIAVLGFALMTWILRGKPQYPNLTVKVVPGEDLTARTTFGTLKDMKLDRGKAALLRAFDESNKPLGKELRVALGQRRASSQFDKTNIELTESLAKKFDLSEGESPKLRIRHAPGWTPNALWNHPDVGTRISARVAIALLAIQLIIQEPLNALIRQVRELL